MGWIADLLQEIPSAARYKSELEAMEKKVISLEAENVNLRQEIQRRDDVIQNEESHGKHLEEIREKILVLVAQNDRLHDAQIAELVGITKQLAALHLHELRSANFVRSSFGLDDDSYEVTVWFVEQQGRKYLHDHGLL